MKTKRKTFLAALAAFIAAPFARGKTEPKQVVVKAHDPSFGQTSAINIIFDGPPGPVSGRFVEVELDDGRSIKAGGVG